MYFSRDIQPQSNIIGCEKSSSTNQKLRKTTWKKQVTMNISRAKLYPLFRDAAHSSLVYIHTSLYSSAKWDHQHIYIRIQTFQHHHHHHRHHFNTNVCHRPQYHHHNRISSHFSGAQRHQNSRERESKQTIYGIDTRVYECG